MKRQFTINNYNSNNESTWVAPTGGVVLGGGKDWDKAYGKGQLSIGPISWIEYDFLRRPDITEKGVSASRLQLGQLPTH